MAFGLTDKDVELIRSALASFSEVEEALVFGSRAMGNHKRGSDVDLAIKGATINMRSVSGLSAKLNEELPLPYRFDIVDYKTIDTPALIEHIDSFGKPIFQRKG